MKKFFGVLLLLPSFLWAGLRIYHWVSYDIKCRGHIKRAADASTVELAKNELRTVVAYLEKNKITHGYTSVLYRTPDEDVGFWYNNLKGALHELEKIEPSTTQLERSNILMKIRESLLDEGKYGVYITAPPGISIFPYNVFYAWFGLFALIGGIIGIVLIFGKE